jgi:hypothetical protein
MGFVVNKEITTDNNVSLSSFYVRINNYVINKANGNLIIGVGHYTDKESAAQPYIEDGVNFSGNIGFTMSYDDVSDFQFSPVRRYPLTETVTVPIQVRKSEWSHELIEYIDFDEDGNEVVKERREWTEIVTYETENQPRTRINIDVVNDNVYQYAYSKLIDEYMDIFGSVNIINETI